MKAAIFFSSYIVVAVLSYLLAVQTHLHAAPTVQNSAIECLSPAIAPAQPPTEAKAQALIPATTNGLPHIGNESPPLSEEEVTNRVANAENVGVPDLAELITASNFNRVVDVMTYSSTADSRAFAAKLRDTLSGITTQHAIHAAYQTACSARLCVVEIKNMDLRNQKDAWKTIGKISNAIGCEAYSHDEQPSKNLTDFRCIVGI